MAADVSMREKKITTTYFFYLLVKYIYIKNTIKWQLINYIHYQYMHELNK